MKLQNMSVIFIVIIIPIILVISYYIGLEIKTITAQNNYNTRLQTAVKDSIQALEINTVEWNSETSKLADSRRRDVQAAINTFTTSLANSMGMSGASKERMQAYLPAIAYTMYDGYYIYSASLVNKQQIDSDGKPSFDDTTGQPVTETATYEYVLKPYTPYSARYVNGNIDITVNYTLDNYIKIYGTIDNWSSSISKEGYLVNPSEITGITNGNITGIKYKGSDIGPENLTEYVYVGGSVLSYPYIYDQNNNKLYWDGNKFFEVSKNHTKVFLPEQKAVGTSEFKQFNRFRKISVPQVNATGDVTSITLWQVLNPTTIGGTSTPGKIYTYDSSTNSFIEVTGYSINLIEDYSAINYCIESYIFTQWVNNNLNSITAGNMQVLDTSDTTVKNLSSISSYDKYNHVETGDTIFSISGSNNPDPENKEAYSESIFAKHKKDVIINTVEANLAQATEQAQQNNVDYEYRLPIISYNEWEQALENISIIAYMQGIPLGLKYYNSYAIATSTKNKEYVDPDEIYFSGENDEYYHIKACTSTSASVSASSYTGYRSIDYVQKIYKITDASGTEIRKAYYKHANATNNTSELSCYYCLVNRANYNKVNDAEPVARVWNEKYYNALARERYVNI